MKVFLLIMLCSRWCEPSYIIKYQTEQQCIQAAASQTKENRYGMNVKAVCVPEVKQG